MSMVQHNASLTKFAAVARLKGQVFACDTKQQQKRQQQAQLFS
jgi:hypothetical protein